jgi:hypothetical protein
MATQPQAPDTNAVKERMHKVWTSDEYSRIGNPIATMGEAAPRKQGARALLPPTVGQAYERFLGLPVVVVLAVMWLAGAALLGSVALVLYSTGWALVRLAAGFI